MMEVYLAWTKSENSAKVVEFNDGFFDENLLKYTQCKKRIISIRFLHAVYTINIEGRQRIKFILLLLF